jgi:hypothetical protein
MAKAKKAATKKKAASKKAGGKKAGGKKGGIIEEAPHGDPGQSEAGNVPLVSEEKNKDRKKHNTPKQAAGAHGLPSTFEPNETE